MRGQDEIRALFSLKEASAMAREPGVAAAIDAVDRYLASASGPGRFRLARNSADAGPDVTAYRGLASIGVTQAFIPEAHGGSGLAPGAAILIGERLGWALAREPFVENVVLPLALMQKLGRRAPVDAQEIPCVAWQEGAFALPHAGGIATRATARGDRLQIEGRKDFVMGARASTQLIVLASMSGDPALVCVPAVEVKRKDKRLADGTCWSELEFDVTVDRDAVLATGPACIEALAFALDLSNLALAGILHGLQSKILSMTLDYLGTRKQFDRPLASFQALQHRAVDLYSHAQIARFLLGEAADAADDGVAARTLAAYASRAKARTADSALRIAKEGIQMHGAIGFSDEYDLGLYVKRILVLSAWLGGAQWHRQRFASLDTLAVAA